MWSGKNIEVNNGVLNNENNAICLYITEAILFFYFKNE